MSPSPDTNNRLIQCVVQIGFAGSRRLIASSSTDSSDEARWTESIRERLIQSLKELPEKLKLSPQHFLCGVSQIACGADTVFSFACQELQIPQRIFLPQPLDEYLSAKGSTGEPDFSEAQKAESSRLVGSVHIIQTRVVSQSPDRTDRFRETNAEILRSSDVLVCLLREEVTGKAGGTNELLDRAKAVGTPVLEIRIGIKDGSLTYKETMHFFSGIQYHPPSIPQPLGHLKLPAIDSPIPSIQQYCAPLKKLVSTQAKRLQKFFRYAAAAIILTHLIATFCATLALTFHGHSGTTPHGSDVSANNSNQEGAEKEHLPASTEHKADAEPSPAEKAIPFLLGLEFILLATGFLVHRNIHHSEATRIWANARVVAELARSISSIYPRHIGLEYLFGLPLPTRFRPLLSTLNVLYLRSTFPEQKESWNKGRDQYIVKRVENQIEYYRDRLKEDLFRLKWCQRIFQWCSVIAMTATLGKFILVMTMQYRGLEIAFWPQFLGTLAIVLPVLAVAGLSWSSALDCEARVETFREAIDSLEQQKAYLLLSDTCAEFDKLLLETETILLGEVANWFSRRSNTGVN